MPAARLAEWLARRAERTGPEMSGARRPRVLSAEARVLLLTAGGPCADDEIRRLAGTDIDWNRVCSLADEERAAGGAWRRLAQVVGPHVDPSGGLARLARVADFRMAVLRQRLEQTLAALDAAGVGVVLLKGAALATAHLDSFTDRAMEDVDLLIRAADGPRAARALLDAGWVWHPLTREAEAYDGHHHLRPLYDAAASRKNLELHTDLLSHGHPFGLHASAVWREARPATLGACEVLVPTPTHLLLHTCVHFAWSHAMHGGAWRTIRDVCTLTAAAGFDWDAFVSAAHAARAGSCCYWTLRIADRLAGVRTPPAVLARLGGRGSEALRRRVERHFLANVVVSEERCPSVFLERRLWELAIRPRPSGHGAARPWRGANAVDLPDQAADLGTVERARRRVRGVRELTRYVSML